MKKVKLGFIGAGGIIRASHLPSAKVLENKIEFVAIADVDKPRAENLAKDNGINNVFEDYNKMLNSVELDAVVIGLPNCFHADAAIKSLNHKCHVLVEKPMAMNTAEAKQMLTTAQKNDKFLAIGFQNRFASETMTLKKMINNNEFGEIYYAKTGAIRRRGIPGWGGGWFTTKSKSGGGALIDIGVHVLDLTLWLMGYPQPVAVSGKTYAKFGKRKDYINEAWQFYGGKNPFNVDDFASAMIKFDNNATLMLEAIWASNSVEEKLYCQIMGTDAGAEWRPIQVFRENKGVLVDIIPQLPKKPITAHSLQMKQFIESIQNNSWKNEDKLSIATAKQGFLVMQIVDAIYKSAETGNEIRIKSS